MCCNNSQTHCWLQACTLDGTTYDITNIVPYIQKFHRHPATGEPLELKDVVKLSFHKNADGEYHCPVLHKVFTEATHIVALRPTGNVFCYEVRNPAKIRFMVVLGRPQRGRARVLALRPTGNVIIYGILNPACRG